MNSKQIVSELMRQKGFTAQALSVKLGYKTTSGVTERIRGKHEMRVDTLISILEAMDCELVIRSKLKDKTEHVVTLTEEGESK